MAGERPDPKETVRAGWDRASRIYRPDGALEDRFGHGMDQYRVWLRPLIETLPAGGPVLDLGCGCGVPVARILAESFRVTGVDFSEVQIARARALVPRADFRCADMTTVDFPTGSFAAVVSFYALIHVPRMEQQALLQRIFDWSLPGAGLLLMTGAFDWRGYEENWLGSGATMYWDHPDATTYRRWIEASGFTVLEERLVPEDAAGHELFWARRAL